MEKDYGYIDGHPGFIAKGRPHNKNNPDGRPIDIGGGSGCIEGYGG